MSEILWRIAAAVAVPRRALRIGPSLFDLARAHDVTETELRTLGRRRDEEPSTRGAEALLARHLFD